MLEYGGVVLREVAEEAFQHFYLVGCQVIYGVEFVNVAEKRENLPCVAQMLVNVVEVGKHQFAPTVELVEGFVLACNFAV